MSNILQRIQTLKDKAVGEGVIPTHLHMNAKTFEALFEQLKQNSQFADPTKILDMYVVITNDRPDDNMLVVGQKKTGEVDHG